MRSIAIASVLAASLALGGCDNVPNVSDAARALFEKAQAIAFRKGKFKGDLEVRFLSSTSGDGRHVELIQLLKPFGYTDGAGVEWDVPVGFLSDGASIPDWLWPALGGPFSGPYRDAAVIHDYFCWAKTRKWEDVHKMFFEAAINRGTKESLAKTLYAGVLYGGPRWPPPATGLLQLSVAKAQVAPAPPSHSGPSPAAKSDKDVFDELKAWIERDKPTLDQIKKRVEEIRKAQGLPKR